MPNRKKNNRNNRKKRVNNNRQINSMLALPKQMSYIGTTSVRSLDVNIPIYAVNNLGTPFYSVGTSTAAPVIAFNIAAAAVLTYPEYAQIARSFNLIQLKGVEVSLYRSSNFIGNGGIISTLPSISFCISPLNYLAGSITQQQALATNDNSSEFNLVTFDAASYKLNFPPVVSGKSSSANDIFTYGSMTWSPTTINGVQTLPDIFFNLGSLSQPTFPGTAAVQAYLVATAHVRLNVVFAGPQSL